MSNSPGDVRNRNMMRDYLVGKSCKDCGMSNPICFEFDHVRGTKKARLSEMVSHGAAWATILKEIDKCEIVCANCHRIRTATRGGHYRALRRESDLMRVISVPSTPNEASMGHYA